MGRYNPNFPTVLGNEFAPVGTNVVNMDTGTLLGYRFRGVARENVLTARVVSTQSPPGRRDDAVVMVDLYQGRIAPGSGPLRKVIVPLSVGALLNGADTIGGGVNLAQFLGSPADPRGVRLNGPNSAIRWQATFNTAKLNALMRDARIFDVSVLYQFTGPFESYNTPVFLSLERTTDNIVYDIDYSMQGIQNNAQNVNPRRARLGELNPFWSNTYSPLSNPTRMPWRYLNGTNGFTGLHSFSTGGPLHFRFSNNGSIPAGVTFTLQYCAIEITYGAESRVAAGARALSSNGPDFGYGDNLYNYDVPINSMQSWGSSWSSLEGQEYIIAAGLANMGLRSEAGPVPVPLSRLDPGPRPFRGHRGVLIRKTLREDQEWTMEEVPEVPAIVPFTASSYVVGGVFDVTTIYEPAQVYNDQIVLDVMNLTGTGDVATEIPDDQAGDVYTHIRFYARALPGTLDALTLEIDQGGVVLGITAGIERDAFEALPEVGNGWKQVTLPLSAPLTTIDGGLIRVSFLSGADSSSPWQVLGADANPGNQATGPYTAATYAADASVLVDGNNDVSADLSVMLVTAMPVPAGLTAVPAVQPLAVMDEACGAPVQAIPTGIRYTELSWEPVNTVAVAGFGHYEIQRRDTTMPPGEWETVARITNVAIEAMDDYEARVGVSSTYRIRTVHEDGYTGDWSNTAASTVLSPGVTGEGVDESVLILTTNHNPGGNLAYVQTWDAVAPPPQDFTYVEAGTTQFQTMYGRDYRVAFRPLERGGVEFTRTLMLNAAGVPEETLTRGVTALRDLAWATVPYVCVRDERGNRWLTSVAVPGSAHRDVPRGGHLVLATATFSEVTAVPAPLDYATPCEGLALENRSFYQAADTVAPSALTAANIIYSDTFTRTVAADSWGTPNLGPAWVKLRGGANVVASVSGGAGQLQSSTVATEGVMEAPVPGAHYLISARITFPALATGSFYETGIVYRVNGATNYYRFALRADTSGNWGTAMYRTVAGVQANPGVYQAIGTMTAGMSVELEILVQGATIRMRTWKTVGGIKPAWSSNTSSAYTVYDATMANAPTYTVGVAQIRNTGNTNANLTLLYDNVQVRKVVSELDARVLLRPLTEDPTIDIGSAVSPTDGTDTTGNWYLGLQPGRVEFYVFGVTGTYSAVSTKMAELGVARNRLVWLRVRVSGDNGNGGRTATFFTSQDGTVWTTVETVTVSGPREPLPLLAPTQKLSVGVLNERNVVIHRYELWADGVQLASPDFAAAEPGDVAVVDGQGNVWAVPTAGGLRAGQQ